MQDVLIDLLACPECRSSLDVEDALRGPEGAIEQANLRCTGCFEAYPVVRGIPRLVPVASRAARDGRMQTAEAFGYEWSRYPRSNPYTLEQVVEWFSPLVPDDFSEKVVLDGGCGTGGFAAYVSEFSASAVVAMDLGDSVEVAQSHAQEHRNLHVVQGDILNPPLRPAFDLCYSIGVLHHLPVPRDGFVSLASLVREGGSMFAWVYGFEGNAFVRRIIDPVRRFVTSRLPHGVVKWGMALPLSIVVWIVMAIGYRPGTPRWRARAFPFYREYLEWLSMSSFSFVHGVVFDQLVAPTTHYVKRAEFAEWFSGAGLRDVVLTARNANSWRGLGSRARQSQACP